MAEIEAQGVPTHNLAVLAPHALFALAPYLHLPFEASTRRTSRFVFSCGDEVVDAEGMRLVQCLYDGKVGLCGVVYVDATRAGSREQLRACGCHGKDIACLGMSRLDCVKREVLFRLCYVRTSSLWSCEWQQRTMTSLLELCSFLTCAQR
jgi:hypothetical protein